MSNQTVFEVLNDDKRNLKMVEETINEIRAASFQTTYTAQQKLINLQRFDLKFQDFKEDRMFDTKNSYKLVANIEGNFIEHTHRARYRTSKFYNKELTLETIHSNPDIFANTTMMFIDGVLYEGFSLLCREDITQIILDYKMFESMDGLSKDVVEYLYENNASVTILFIKNNNIEVFNTNIHAIKQINKRNNGRIPLSYFKPKNSLELQTTKLCFVNTDYELDSKTFYDTSIESDEIIIDNITGGGVYKNISLYNMLHIDSIIDLPSNEEYFEIPIHDTPICTENMIVFKKEDDKYLFAHDVKIDLYYPNIYHIDGNTDELKIIVLYFDDTLSITSQHINELKLYHKFVNNIVDKYKDETIPEKIKMYEPISFKYDFKDYFDNEKYPDHLNYKISKLKSLVLQNAEYYTKYLEKLVGYVPTFYLKVSEIDLESKVRLENTEEIDDISIQKIFDEPRYLFIFRNDVNGSVSNVSIFIDGLHYYPDITHVNAKYRFVYIPCSLIHEDSIIEVEKKYDHEFRKGIANVDSSTTYEINCQNRFSINSIFVVNINNKSYVEKELYKIYRKNENGEKVLIDKDDFYTYDKVYMEFDSSLNGENIQIISVVNNIDLLTHSFRSRLDLMIQNDESNIRMYKNGYNIPSSSFNIKFGEEFDRDHLLGTKFLITEVDDLAINLGSYKYKLIYKQDRIEPSGFVDLKGKIDKPLNFKWHDIYLNGIKLTKYDVEILTPFKMIIKDRGTIRNLIIYEKNLYGLGNGTGTDFNPPLNTPDDNFFDDDLKDIIIGDREDIDDILPDIMDDVLENIDVIFNDVILKIGLLNPNIDQIVDEILRICEDELNEENDLFIDPDDMLESKKFLFLDPNRDLKQ